MHNFDAITNVVFAVGRIGPGGVGLLGTAFLTAKAGHFVTAAHVAGTDDSNLVLAFKELPNLGAYQDTSSTEVKMFSAKIAGVDPFHDLAILKADVDVASNIATGGSDAAPVGCEVCSFGYPHADHGRMVLTRQNAEIGARILISSGKTKAKHVVLNQQARPGQSGSPVFRQDNGHLIAILIGSYAPGGGGGISLGGVDPHTLHQTTHAVSAEYILKMI